MKKSKKNIIFALLFIAGIFLFFVLMDIQEIMDYSKIEAAGKKVLTPVNVKQTITNYVQFVVEINNTRTSFYMETVEAYGENSPSAGLQAVASKKTIERYIFYTDKHIYYSK